MRGVLDLQLFSDRFVEGLVVGHLLDDLPHRVSEVLVELARYGFRVLDRVVENGRHQRDEVGDATRVRQQVRDGDGMVDVGRRFLVFPALRRVFARTPL
jgi:hypothetical protein